nr:hypothetical protein [Tanacetum cinerariifolium]
VPAGAGRALAGGAAAPARAGAAPAAQPLRADSAQLLRKPRLRGAPRPGARPGAGGRAAAARGPHLPGRAAAPLAHPGLA